MNSSRIPSPARSQGFISTPRRYKPRASRSVGSPARSNTSVKLSAMVQMEKFTISPMPSRMSVLSDTTDINVPTRKSWWKKLDENSREIMDVVNSEGPVQNNNAIEEYIDIDVLSQEKEKQTYALELPESSDGESIGSIVIPQRKLFTQKNVEPQQKFKQIMNNRESLAKLNKSQRDHEKTLHVGRKNLLNQGTKQRTKPLFPSALLNISPNKTIANKTKDFAAPEINCQAKNLFGNRGGTKRKNMFVDFIVPESEDEIPEIQAKIFGFQKKNEQKRRKSLRLRDAQDGDLPSPTASITDTEMDDWRLLPSSTMVDHQIEDGLRTTPNKRVRLSKSLRPLESTNPETNVTGNKSKPNNKSRLSKNLSKSKNMVIDGFALGGTNNNELNTVTHDQNDKNNQSKNSFHRQSLGKESTNSNNDKLKSASIHKTVVEVVNHIEDKHSTTSEHNKLNENKITKTLSRIDQVLQSDDDKEFSLVYDNDDELNGENNEREVIIRKETSNLIIRPESIIAKKVEQDSKSSAEQKNKMNVEIVSNNNEDSKNMDKNDGKHGNQITDVQRNDTRIISVNQQINTHAEKKSEEQCIGGVDENEEEDIHDSGEKVTQEEELHIEEEIKEDTEQGIPNEDESDIDKENVDIDLSKNDLEEDSDNNDENIEEDEVDNQTPQEVIQNEANNTNDKQYKELKKLTEDTMNNAVTNYDNIDMEQNRRNIDKINKRAGNESLTKHNSTTENKKKNEQKLPSPEICRKQNKTSEMESFTVEGRKTDGRRTKSNIKNLTIRPSLLPVRESLEFSNGSRNSTTEGSGWDSHRTTRATLRQTFGKDFTPRKSLRALVMEKSAKRQTNHTEINTEFSRFPQANSTELPTTEQFDFSDKDDAQKINKSNHEISHEVSYFDAEHKMRKCPNSGQPIKSTDAKELNKSSSKVFFGSKKINVSANVSNINKSHNIMSADINPQSLNVTDSSRETHHKDSNISLENNASEEVQEMNEFNEEVEHNEEVDDSQQTNESNDAQEINDSNLNDSNHEVSGDDAQEINETDNEQEMNDSDHEVSCDNNGDAAREMNETNNEQEMNKTDNEQEINETDNEQEMNETDNEQEMNETDNEQEMNETDNEQEINESKQEMSNDEHSDDADVINKSDEESHDVNESDVAQEENNISDEEESHDVDDIDERQEMDKSNQEMSHNVNNSDIQEPTESDDQRDNLESDHEASSDNDDSEEGNETNNSHENQETNEFEYAQESNRFDREFSVHQDKSDVKEMMPERELSRKTRQTTLETYLQSIINRKLERRKQLVDEVMNTLKTPSRDLSNPFKAPAVPKLRRTKTQQIKPKPKARISSVISRDMLPPEVLEDMKYKPPKRYRPANASWITKRLYKFLETKLEPKYDYKARVRSEKLVETLYNFVKDIKRLNVAPAQAIDELKKEMARLDVVKTHAEFYEFFHEYMPREVRVKVVPDLFNKISLPKRGVFSDILR